MTPEIASILLWLVFLLSWHVAMLWTARAVTRDALWRRLVYLAGFVIGFWLLFMRPEWLGVRAVPRPEIWARPLWREIPALAWALVTAQFAGFAFAWWARVHLGRLWSGMLTLREGHKVVDTGPYGLVRHPIYTGFIAAILAFALLKANPAALAGGAILTLTIGLKAKTEERFLRRELGADVYDVYATKPDAGSVRASLTGSNRVSIVRGTASKGVVVAKSLILGLTFVSTVAAAAAPSAAPPAPGPRTSTSVSTQTGHAAWAIDYGVQRCSLIRTIEGPDSLTLAIRLIPGHVLPDVLLAKPDWHDSKIPNAAKVQLVIEPAGTTFEAEPVTVPFDNNPAGHIVQMAGPSGFLDALATANRLDIRVRDHVALSLSLPGAAKAVAALHDCDDALVTSWGIDLKARAALVEEPRPVAMGEWLRSEDYPESAMRNRVMGTVVVRLAVDPQGRVGQCAVVAGSGDKDLDDATCHDLKLNAFFRPAIGAEGEPVAATTLQTVQWRIAGGRVRN